MHRDDAEKLAFIKSVTEWERHDELLLRPLHDMPDSNMLVTPNGVTVAMLHCAMAGMIDRPPYQDLILIADYAAGQRILEATYKFSGFHQITLLETEDTMMLGCSCRIGVTYLEGFVLAGWHKDVLASPGNPIAL